MSRRFLFTLGFSALVLGLWAAAERSLNRLEAAGPAASRPRRDDRAPSSESRSAAPPSGLAQGGVPSGSRGAPNADAAVVAQAWERAARAMRRGAYQEALDALDVILARSPEDARARLYRGLAEKRLKSPGLFPQLSAPELEALGTRLRAEEQDRRRADANRKALERRVRAEQRRWDRQLAAQQAAAAAEAARIREAAEAQAAASRRAEHAARREAARQARARVTAAPPPASAGATPFGLAQGGAPARGAAPDVQLAPVTVQAAQPELSPLAAISPTLRAQPPPPAGAVKIKAKQLRMSPDQRVAVAEGNVELLYGNAFMTCDRLTLFTDTKDAYAEGRVRIEEGQQIFRGDAAHYNLRTKKGRFLQGTLSSPPWRVHGRSVEHIAEGVYEVTPGYITSCDLEPPHFQFQGRRAIIFADDRLARGRAVTLLVEQFPLVFFPWLSFADRQTPFFFIPGKKKPWEQFALMGYRYELPRNQKGTMHLDWRRTMGWGTGLDHQFDDARLGKGLLKLYYNEERYDRVQKELQVKGSKQNRYRVLWRHLWRPQPDMTMVTNLQKFSDEDFRKDFLFREEYVRDDVQDSFISVVKATKDFSVTGLVRKRMNRFETVDELLPEITLDTGDRPIGDSRFYSASRLDVANFNHKRRHSANDTDVFRVDWFQQLSCALNLLKPILLTPRTAVRQTFYTKDIQSGPDAVPGNDRYQGRRDLFSGQVSMGLDASLKLFRIFPVASNALGLNVYLLRHVLTPTVAYRYVHRPTVRDSLLTFSAAEAATHDITFGLENKLQTKRLAGGKPRSVDLGRFLVSLPYTFRGTSNKQGGRLGNFGFDLETYPWPWMRLESDWTVPSHFDPRTRDNRITTWNLDLVVVGGKGEPRAAEAADIQAPAVRVFEAGPRGGIQRFLPLGQWYLGLGHRYSQNDKTEEVIQFDWGLSDKWEISTFHRLTLKEMAGGAKRFNNVREYQYGLRRDLHDWVAELMYRVDREYGEELFLTVTLKALPEMPIDFGDSYHQPKIGSQESPFSPVSRL